MSVLICVIAGCSSSKNTAGTRWWKAFNAHYNTYYNGTLAYIDGSLEKENGNKDNFTELIPLYTVGNKNSRELGKSNYDRAIQKSQKAIQRYSIKRRPEWDKNRKKTARDIEWLQRREYNPFLWKAWMLMGRSQFYEGDFDGAASTFNYMSRLYATQPAIYSRAQAWLAKTYVESGWLYDAEEVIRNARRDTIPSVARKEWDYTLADYYIHTQHYAEAIPHLKKVIRHEMRRKQKAREYFLLGQIYALTNMNQDAYKAYQRAVRTNPPYELELNARVAQTEVMAARQAGKMIGRLKRMAASDKNKDYLDQVYYAMGNIYLSQRDTAKAISAYERGGAKSTRNGVEKGVLMLKLGNLYWDKERFADAQRCYTQAVGMLDKERKDYAQLTERSKVLDALVPYTEAVHLQDSLQSLAKMDDAHRNAAIDRVIEALKQKEKEEKRAQEAQDASNQLAEGNDMERQQQTSSQRQATVSAAQQNGAWYFYNPVAVQQGKQLFQRMWGKRKNADNWQRANKTVVADNTSNTNIAAADSLFNSNTGNEATADSVSEDAKKLNPSDDPHTRAYYMAQIPFTDDQRKASNSILCDGLFNSGIIFKDQLGNLELSRKALERLDRNYPDYEKSDEVLYHLFLLYSRMGEATLAQQQVTKLKAKYPNSHWTTLLSDPNYLSNARYGEQIEDSLYGATYDAFKAERYTEVMANSRVSERRFPQGQNRDKFIFIYGLSRLNEGDSQGCLAAMDTLVANFPESKLAELAGMIINGVKAGRQLRGGHFDIGNFWQRRTDVLTEADKKREMKLSNERNTPFCFLLVYAPDSVRENQLLFQVARYNFTSYLVRDFDIVIDDLDGIHRMRISGFNNYDEARQYANQVMQQPSVQKLTGKARAFIVSQTNLPLLGAQFSYDDYSKFYNTHFAPLKISTSRLLIEPAEVVTQPGKEKLPMTEKEVDDYLNGITVEPEDTQGSSSTYIPVDNDADQSKGKSLSTEVVTEPENRQKQGGTIIPTNDDDAPTVLPATKQEKAETKADKPAIKTKQQESQRQQPLPKAQTSGTKKETPAGKTANKAEEKRKTEKPKLFPDMTNGAEIIFDDTPVPAKPSKTGASQSNKTQGNKTSAAAKQDVAGKAGNNSQPDKAKANSKAQPKREKSFDLEDEYYDLDGF
ncbi:tetratricopeptide repeat protein [Prevotellaceae bacterium LKV-178-WT-2A]|uniref:Tetratricopeptide repeat protein n=1 Tax=Hallella mizrahii TaxID=2606637 RepID=A0A7K0KDG7_9BACT|nr:tetratricopeptide repeat protein [Hallella mizrahii]